MSRGVSGPELVGGTSDFAPPHRPRRIPRVAIAAILAACVAAGSWWWVGHSDAPAGSAAPAPSRSLPSVLPAPYTSLSPGMLLADGQLPSLAGKYGPWDIPGQNVGGAHGPDLDYSCVSDSVKQPGAIEVLERTSGAETGNGTAIQTLVRFETEYQASAVAAEFARGQDECEKWSYRDEEEPLPSGRVDDGPAPFWRFVGGSTPAAYPDRRGVHDTAVGFERNVLLLLDIWVEYEPDRAPVPVVDRGTGAAFATWRARVAGLAPATP